LRMDPLSLLLWIAVIVVLVAVILAVLRRI
jgi:hypothetical protein